MTELRFKGSVWCNIDVALRRAGAIYKEETDRLGLVVIEWYILQVLYEQDGQMASQIAKAVGRAATSFTPILDSLENKGFIERRIHPSDRRGVLIHLTAAGKALEEQVKASAKNVESKLREHFADKDWQSFQNVVADLQVMD